MGQTRLKRRVSTESASRRGADYRPWNLVSPGRAISRISRLITSSAFLLSQRLDAWADLALIVERAENLISPTHTKVTLQVSVRGRPRSVVGLKFGRDQPTWPMTVTHEQGLARRELGEAAAPECFHMNENIGRLRTAG